MKGKTRNGIRECLSQKGEITGYQAIVRETDHLGRKIRTTKKWPKRSLAKTWRDTVSYTFGKPIISGERSEQLKNGLSAH